MRDLTQPLIQRLPYTEFVYTFLCIITISTITTANLFAIDTHLTIINNYPISPYALSSGAALGSGQEEAAEVLRAEVIWCTVLRKWLFMALTLERLSLADGIVLASIWSPTVSRHPGFVVQFPC